MSDSNQQSSGRFEYGRTMATALLALAVTSALTIAGGGLEGDNVRRAMWAFAVAIPTLTMHLLVTEPSQRKGYHVSFLMKLASFFGIFASPIGFGFLLELAVPIAGVIFGVTSGLCLTVCVQSDDRAKAQQCRLRITPQSNNKSDKAAA